MLQKLHLLKINIARYLLTILEPDVDRIIGESVAHQLDKKRAEWEVALLSIQAEVAEEFGGGLLHGVPSVPALCEKIKRLTRSWRLKNHRERKLIYELDVANEGAIVPRVRELIQIDYQRERERKLFDDAFVEFRRAFNAFKHAMVPLYDLLRSYDIEERVGNKLAFESEERKD